MSDWRISGEALTLTQWRALPPTAPTVARRKATPYYTPPKPPGAPPVRDR